MLKGIISLVKTLLKSRHEEPIKGVTKTKLEYYVSIGMLLLSIPRESRARGG